MMKRNLFLPLFFIFFALKQTAQPDTLIVYDISSQQTNLLPPVAFNTTVSLDKTSSSIGSFGNPFPLSLSPPTVNLFSGSNFSDLARALDFFPLITYPARTAISLRKYKNDTLSALCSGMIVSPCFAVTSAACIYDFVNKNFSYFDSLEVFPAFNNGTPQLNLPTSMVKKIYLFKTFYDQSHWDDIALLELNDPIGLQTGWTGIGFNTGANFVGSQVFHKFSYPATANPGNSVKVYNGDTLYYNYGLIDDTPPWLSVNSPAATAIPGQGGSTFMSTDNGGYYSVGVSSFSSDYLHYKITNAGFYQLRNVLINGCSSVALSIDRQTNEDMALKLYPNPMDQRATLEFNYDPAKHYNLRITNNLGQEVRKATAISAGKTVISRAGMASGIYLLQLSDTEGMTYTCKMLIE